MKLKLVRLIIFVLICTTHFTNAQTPTFQWAKGIGGTQSDDGLSIVHDASGNIYATGYFTGIVDFDPGPGTFIIVSSGSSRCVFITKFDPLGNLIWAKQLADGPVAVSLGSSITVDGAGNVYTTGSFSGTGDFDPGIGTFNLISFGTTDIFISKLDASGNFIWAKSMGGTLQDEGISITLDNSGNVYTTGTFKGTIDADPGAGVFNLTCIGQINVFISKLDAAGNFVWAKSIGADIGNDVDIASNGDVYVAGGFRATVDFDPGAGTYNLTTGGTPDVFILRLNAAGNFLSVISIGGALGDIGYSLVLDASGNVLLIGIFGGTVDFDPGPGVFNISILSTISDVFILKLDALGNFVWAKNIGGVNTSIFASSIALDLLGNIYTVGRFYSVTDFDPGVGTFTLGMPGNQSAFILKLNGAGNFVWAKDIGGDFAYSVTVDQYANVYTTGYFIGSADFDPDMGTYSLTAVGQSDIFVHKIGQCVPPSAPVDVTAFSNKNICSNQSTTLSVSGTGTFSWFSALNSTLILGTGAAFVTPSMSPGTYTYFVDVFTCTNSISQTPIAITVAPDLTLSVTGMLNICKGDKRIYTATGGNSYQWSNNTSASTVTLSPATTTVYSVTGYSNGCSSSKQFTLVVDPCLGIGVNKNDEAVRIFPNPVDDILSVETLAPSHILMFDINGRLISDIKVGSGHNEINTSELDAGVYMVRLETGENIWRGKLIKLK